MDTKRCKVCGEEKPLDDFYTSAGMRGGHRNDCKPCNLAAKKARYLADPAAAIARARRWQQANADRVNEYWRRRRQEPAQKRRERDGHLRRKFGITIEQYEAMLEAQGGGCAICGRPEPPGRSLHVDHDHRSQQRRGLLCFRCNAAVGQLEEDAERVRAAARYLDEHDPEVGEVVELIRRRARALAG